MCLRHVKQQKGILNPSAHQFFPLLTEQEARSNPNVVLSIVDVLCTKPECFFQNEDTWKKLGLRLKPNQSCGYSGCLSKSSCCLISVPPPLLSSLSCSVSPPRANGFLQDQDKRSRYVLRPHSVCSEPYS